MVGFCVSLSMPTIFSVWCGLVANLAPVPTVYLGKDRQSTITNLAQRARTGRCMPFCYATCKHHQDSFFDKNKETLACHVLVT